VEVFDNIDSLAFAWLQECAGSQTTVTRHNNVNAALRRVRVTDIVHNLPFIFTFIRAPTALYHTLAGTGTVSVEGNNTMSAYKRIKCKIVNKECLIQALDNLGLKTTVHESPVALRGYAGDLRNNKAEIVVSKQNINANYTGASNDLGFTWNEKEGAYDIVCSEYDVAMKVPQRVMQSYAVEVIKKAAEANRFTIKQNVEPKNLQSKTRQKVKLVFGKVV